MVVGTEDIPTGENLILSASFDKDGKEADRAHRDPLALPRRHEGRRRPDQDPARRVRDRRRGPVRRPPQRRAGHRDYPGEPPYAFTGGTINRVAVDVSGEPYVDLEREAQVLIRSQ